MIIRKNGNYFHRQDYQTGLFNGNALCFVWGNNGNFIYYIDELRASKG
jgi:hypothetical protein